MRRTASSLTSICFALALLAGSLAIASPVGAAPAAGTRLLAFDEDRAVTVRGDGTEARTVLAPAGRLHAAAWGPGGRQIVHAAEVCVTSPCRSTPMPAATSDVAVELRITDSLGRSPRTLLRLPVVFVGDLAWSPDGRWVSFLASRGSCWGCPPVWELHVVEVVSAAQLSLGPASAAVWSPDGRRLAVESGGVVSVVDVAAREQPRTVSPAGTVAVEPRWRPDGRALAFTGFAGPVTSEPGHVHTVGLDGAPARKLAVRTFGDVEWSPDGRRFVLPSLHYDALEVWSADGKLERRITTPRGQVFGPTWSPGGTTIAYVHAPGDAGSESVRAVAPDGRSDRHLLGGFDALNGQLAWSR